MPNSSQDKPTAVTRCRIPGHRKHQAGCPTCKAHSSYYYQLLRWERRVGIHRGNVPVGPVRAHLVDLIENGNRRQWDISDESGIPLNQINLIINGHRETVTVITSSTLLAIKPSANPTPPNRGMVPAYEGRRTLRGLAAQGWTNPTVSDLMGGTGAHATQKMTNDPSPWMLRETRDRIRAVARLLGGKDIIRDGKLPGMDLRTRNHALKNGWAPLWAWEGRNIADPDATPAATLRLVEDDDDTAPTGEGEPAPFVDPVLLVLVRKNAQRLDTIRSHGGRPDDQDEAAAQLAAAWVDPIGSMTVLEKYAAVAYGTHLGMSLAELGALLGYPVGTRTEIEGGQRAASRVRKVTTMSAAWVATDPAGETPDWWTEASRSGVFQWRVPALLAMLPAPVGPGWDITELAKRSGVTEDEMSEFVGRALQAADRPWRPSRAGETARAA